MYHVEIYVRVRRACMVEGMSVREASRVFGLHRDTVRKMLAYSAPPGYRRQDPPRRPRLEPFTGVIDAILEADRQVPRKQRHTAKRIFERLRGEHGFDGQCAIVKDYVRERRRRTQEMFVPLSHAPGHAQCDFGEARVIIGGVERKAHYLVLDLPHSDGCFVKAYPAETTEAFLDGRVSAFASLGGVPQSILCDNTKLAVARILGDGRRQRTRAFTELQSHYLFEDRFGRPGKGNDKGKVEGMVGYPCRPSRALTPAWHGWTPCCEDTVRPQDALRLGAISFDAVKHLLLCHLEGRPPPRLDLDLYPYLPRVSVKAASATDYLALLPGRAATGPRCSWNTT